MHVAVNSLDSGDGQQLSIGADTFSIGRHRKEHDTSYQLCIPGHDDIEKKVSKVHIEIERLNQGTHDAVAHWKRLKCHSVCFSITSEL